MLKRGGYEIKALNTILYCALIGSIHYQAPPAQQNMNTLVEMINSTEVHEEDESFQNGVDLMFAELEERDPQHFAVRQYLKYKLAAGVICSKRLIYQTAQNA